MRAMGIHWLAVLVAGIAVYAVGFVIYGVVLDQATWMAASRISAEELAAVGTSRLPFSPVMPLVTAVAMAVLFKWANVAGAVNGIRWGALIAIVSALPAIWYGWVYGVGDGSIELIDSVHLLLGHIVAGAILASWK
jgi:hypothetical protein